MLAKYAVSSWQSQDEKLMVSHSVSPILASKQVHFPLSATIFLNEMMSELLHVARQEGASVMMGLSSLPPETLALSFFSPV